MSEHLLPRGVLDPFCPSGHVITESQDRRWLWHVAFEIGMSAPMGSPLRDLSRTVNRYLADTCEHHWHDDPTGCGGMRPPYRQCLWCNFVEDLPEGATP